MNFQPLFWRRAYRIRRCLPETSLVPLFALSVLQIFVWRLICLSLFVISSWCSRRFVRSLHLRRHSFLVIRKRLRVASQKIVKSNLFFEGWNRVNLLYFFIQHLNCVLNISYLPFNRFHVFFAFFPIRFFKFFCCPDQRPFIFLCKIFTFPSKLTFIPANYFHIIKFRCRPHTIVPIILICLIWCKQLKLIPVIFVVIILFAMITIFLLSCLAPFIHLSWNSLATRSLHSEFLFQVQRRYFWYGSRSWLLESGFFRS